MTKRIVFGVHVDELGYCVDLVEVLQEAPLGHKVLVVGNAGELLGAIAQADLVITLSYMPRGTFKKAESTLTAGFEAVEEARAQGTETPVVFMETSWPAPKVENAIVLEVPVRLENFLETVKQMLG